MTDRPGGREMGGYLLLSYGTAWGIWLMCGMMPPGRCHCSAAQHGGDVDACLGGVADVAGGEAQTGAVFLPAARPEKELEVVSGCLGPIPGCRSPWVRCSILAYIPGILTARFQPWRQ